MRMQCSLTIPVKTARHNQSIVKIPPPRSRARQRLARRAVLKREESGRGSRDAAAGEEAAALRRLVADAALDCRKGSARAAFMRCICHRAAPRTPSSERTGDEGVAGRGGVAAPFACVADTDTRAGRYPPATRTVRRCARDRGYSRPGGTQHHRREGSVFTKSVRGTCTTSAFP